MNSPPRPCSRCGARVYRSGLCRAHYAHMERRRGTSGQRGYRKSHRERFRPEVLAKHPVCTACGERESTVADHYPRTRRELVAAGADPNDPQYGRGLCHPCHSAHTARGM